MLFTANGSANRSHRKVDDMGFFKQMKDLKDMAHEAPQLLSQTAQLAEAAKANAAAQQGTTPTAARHHPATPPARTDMTFGGIDLTLYATIARSFEEVGYDQARGPELAARHGVGAAQWASAVEGWNGQIAADPAIARRFNDLYTGR